MVGDELLQRDPVRFAKRPDAVAVDVEHAGHTAVSRTDRHDDLRQIARVARDVVRAEFADIADDHRFSRKCRRAARAVQTDGRARRLVAPRAERHLALAQQIKPDPRNRPVLPEFLPKRVHDDLHARLARHNRRNRRADGGSSAGVAPGEFVVHGCGGVFSIQCLESSAGLNTEY